MATTEFRKFSQDALDSYAHWLHENHGVEVTFEDPPEKPECALMLAGHVDSVVVNQANKNHWLVVVKQLYQSPQSKPRCINDIAASRESFYATKTASGDWVLKNDTPIYYICQNVLKLFGYERLDLVVYNARNDDILVVPVHFEQREFFERLEMLNKLVNAGNDSKVAEQY
jgi:hypothetical protein